MDIQKLTEALVERALKKLSLPISREGKRVRVNTPSGSTYVVLGDDLLTLRTYWNKSIAMSQRSQAKELINYINSQSPTGKVVPIVAPDSSPSVEFREHYFLNPGVDLQQLVLIFDAYFSVMNSILDDLEQLADKQDGEEE